MPPKIEYSNHFSTGFKLDAHYEKLLQKLYSKCKKVVVVSEFGSGLSGGLVFRIQPSNKDGKQPLSEVVKLGPNWLIDLENRAYHNYIKTFLPRAIGITKFETVKSGNELWGGLRYELAGEEIADLEDLKTYFFNHPIKSVLKSVKGDLFKALAKLHRKPEEKRTSYDRILPVNLAIEAVSTESQVPNGDQILEITPENTVLDVNPGMQVRVCQFMITEVEKDTTEDSSEEYTVTLNRPLVETLPETSYRIRVKLSSRHGFDLQIGAILPPIEGIVKTTRQVSLKEEMHSALFSPEVEIQDEIIRFDGGRQLPNPLLQVDNILKRIARRVVLVGRIHGDLNLQNILVDPSRNLVNIIDFAFAREDHLLHDFLRLETEVVTKIVSAIISGHDKLSPEFTRAFYVNLHNICTRNMEPIKAAWLIPELEKPFKILIEIRKAAQACFYWSLDNNAISNDGDVEKDKGFFLKSSEWAEYNEYLALYLIGTLKFRNLDKQAKKLAIFGAATLLDLSNNDVNVYQLNNNTKVITAQEFPDYDIQVVRVKPGEEKLIEVNGSGKRRMLHVTANESGTLSIRTWIQKPGEEYRREYGCKYELVLQSSCTFDDYPYNCHKFTFERLIGTEQKFVFNDNFTALITYRSLGDIIDNVWWIRHKREGQFETRIFVAVEISK